MGLLRTLEAEGMIVVEHEAVNAFGENPFNPASVLRSAKRPSA